MKNIGLKLKEKREENGLSIEEVAEDLKMRPSQITSIEEGKKDDFKVVILVNIYTNPSVVFLSNIIQLANNTLVYYCSVFILEIGAVIIEAILYKKYLKEKINPIQLSIYSNVFSFGMGIILVFIYEGLIM